MNPTRRDEPDRFGFDESTNYVTTFLGKLVPEALARRAISVTVETDRSSYERADPIAITVTFENRLPVPVRVPTPRSRRWGWSVDGELEGSDERRYMRSNPSTFDFEGGETKRITVDWDGRFERTDGRHERVAPAPGEYEIAAFVATEDRTPRDVTTVTIG